MAPGTGRPDRSPHRRVPFNHRVGRVLAPWYRGAAVARYGRPTHARPSLTPLGASRLTALQELREVRVVGNANVDGVLLRGLLEWLGHGQCGTCPQASVSRAVARGVEFLRDNQLPYGEFRSYIARSSALDRECRFDSSPFVTTFALHALSFVDRPDIAEAVERGLAFLLSEQEGSGLWRHEGSRGPHRYLAPPDLDDTACVSWTLRRHDVPFGANADILYKHRNADGLFLTYIQPLSFKKAWFELLSRERRQLLRPYRWMQLLNYLHDVDIVVNANVVLYLGENAGTVRACRYLNAVVREGMENSSRYYLDAMAFYHAVSRAYFHGVSSLESTVDLVTGRIARRQHPDGSFGDALTTALAACSLLNYGLAGDAGLERAIRHIIAIQGQDGSWPRVAFYHGGNRFYWWGSEELTTALCVEALVRYSTGPHRRAVDGWAKPGE
jgi:hypothetical protein